ncbi:MAG: FUSC family protein [Gluconacetobacter sp.]
MDRDALNVADGPVAPPPTRWTAIRRVLEPRGAEIRQAARLLVSVLLSDLLARVVHLHEPVWSVITSVIVTQSRITQTLTTGRDQIVGTLVGAGAGLLAILMVQTGILPDWVAFWVALTPLALLAAARPNLRFAAVTLMIVLLFPISGDPFLRPLDRIASILIGVVTSLVVTMFVLHDAARGDVLTASGRLIADIADLLDRALRGELDHDTIETIDEACRTHLQEIYGAVAEARVEGLRILRRKADPLLDVLPGLLRRLRGSAVFAARAATEAGELPSVDAALDAERRALARVLSQLSRRCARAARGRRRISREDAATVLAVLHPPGPSWSAPMQFTLGMLHEDLERAVEAVWSDGAAHPYAETKKSGG